MKKGRGEKVVKTSNVVKKENCRNCQKKFGIFLIILGGILLFFSIYMIYSGLDSMATAFNAEGKEGPLVRYLEYIQEQEIHALEKEQTMILYTQRMFDSIFFSTGVYFQLMFFSLILVVLGITNIFYSKEK